MTKQSDEDQSRNKNKPRRKHSAVVQSPQKLTTLIHKDFSTVSLIGLPDDQHKYFIRGGILIDFEQLQRIWNGQQLLFNLKEFNHIRSVSYAPANGFFDVSIEKAVNQIGDFRFIISMLDSLGEKQAHGTANALRKYLASLKALEERRQCSELSTTVLLDTCQNGSEQKLEIELPNSETTAQQIHSESSTIRLCDSNHPDDYPQPSIPDKSSDGKWNFQDSLQKVSQILADETIRKDAQFYYVIKANENCFSVSNYGISEMAMRRVLGQIEQSELTKLLLENGVMFINPSINQVIEMKSQEIELYLSNPTALDPEYMRFVRRMRHVTLNNYSTELEFTFERYRLSNYPNRINDYLVIAKLDNIQLQMLMNQLFLQKLNCFLAQPAKQILQDIRYQAQSEYFADKFYSSKSSQIPTTTTNPALADNANGFMFA